MSAPSTLTGAPNWVELLTTDGPGAQRFYGDLFGWVAEVGDQEKYGGYITFFKDGQAVAGAMQKDESMPMPDTWNVYLSARDAGATLKAAADHGGASLMGPMDVPDVGVMGMAGDTGGSAVGVYQGTTFPGLGVVGEAGTPGWFELHTRSYDKDVQFYADVFGWDPHTASDTPEFRYTTLGGGDQQAAGIMDASAFPEGAPTGWFVYFAVADADATIAKAVELGATVVQPAEDTPYGRLATLADPWGAPIKLIQGPNA